MGRKGLGSFQTPGSLSGSRLVITEGAFDALTLATCGLPAIAFMGTSRPRWFPGRLASKRMVVAFDDDDAGNAGAEKPVEYLDCVGSKVERLVPPGKDWNDCLAGSVDGQERLTEWLRERGLL